MKRNKNIKKKLSHADRHTSLNFRWQFSFFGLLYNSRPGAAVYATTSSDVEVAGSLIDTNSIGTVGGTGFSISIATAPSTCTRMHRPGVPALANVIEGEEREEEREEEEREEEEREEEEEEEEENNNNNNIDKEFEKKCPTDRAAGTVTQSAGLLLRPTVPLNMDDTTQLTYNHPYQMDYTISNTQK
jgi:hypothetical protein